MKKTLFTILATIAAFLAVPSLSRAGENFPVTAGGTAIKIPVPEGYAEVGERKSSFPEQSGNRLLAWFVPADDLKSGKASSTHWMQIQVLKKLESHNLTAAEFGQLVEMTSKQQDQIFNAAKDEINGALKKAADNTGAPTLKIGEMKPMGFFMKKENAFGILMLMGIEAQAVGGEKKADAVIGAATFLRVNDRLIYAYAYCKASETDAAEWVKATAEKWAADIVAANAK